ncbi:hypothetical protein QQS21_001635 [Conoideocrella luteorostrata]|uniref:Amine oxidase domain-containing protein n=1 Tax=Conoideocrella luteorostrata TaxID=1105319 RepID=A0AAJ0CWW4_9HYPO|nr:hypothetical protein QQS21_001635 [Conoideocrella luteorostrata]
MTPTKSGALKQRSSHSSPEPHVAIIGAGLSGLRCADILLRNGFRVTVIEARNRIGGRVHQYPLSNGHFVDLGPNWIHGTADNPFLDLAKLTNTSVGAFDTNAWTYHSAGHLLPLKEAEKCRNTTWGIVQQAFEHSNNHGAETRVQQSLLDFFHEKLPSLIPESETEFERKRDAVLQMAEMWGAFVGSPVSRQSLKYFWLEECLEGENLFCASTYKDILTRIAAPALAEADIKLNSKVQRIWYPSEASGKVEVELNSGQQLAFDEVVVTTPLGWLKRNMDAFNPALPPRLTQAINSIGYGCLEKVYISFPRAFWLSPHQDHKMNGLIQWLTPKYAPDSNPHRWHQEAVELASLKGQDSHPTLLFYMFGEQSKYVTSKLATLTNRDDESAFLRNFFHPYYSRLPNYRADSHDCQPEEFVATEWLNDEFAGNGSYCNFQVGLENGDEDIETMREGLPNQGLWFAGEHTAPFVALGTATGAYWSGEMVGKRISEIYAREGKRDNT